MSDPSSFGAADRSSATEAAKHEADAAANQAKSDFDRVKARALDDAEMVKSEAKSDFDTLRRRAEDEVGHVQDSAMHYAHEQKDYAADQVGRFAAAVDRMGSDLDSHDQSFAGRYVHDLAHGLESLSNSARTSSVEEIIGNVEDFGRRQPAAFIGAAALLGFAASRFLNASRNRSAASAGQSASEPTTTPYGAPGATSARTTTQGFPK